MSRVNVYWKTVPSAVKTKKLVGTRHITIYDYY